MTKKILFARRYFGFTGGHKKVRDYIEHAVSDKRWEVSLYLTGRPDVAADFFDAIPGVKYTTAYDPSGYDVIFLAGLDWQLYLPCLDENQHIINLIQHVRHADQSQQLSDFLKYKATRLCVSTAILDAIMPWANGTSHWVRMGHEIPNLTVDKSLDIYILANKQPVLGKQLATWAQQQGLRVGIDTETQSPSKVHLNMASSRISVTLPHNTEGFYLPGIEAMKLSDYAVIPDCIANREYCRKLANVAVCKLDFDACRHAIQSALKKSHYFYMGLSKRYGKHIADSYALSAERRQFLSIINAL
jgi:hypothetical protein